MTSLGAIRSLGEPFEKEMVERLLPAESLLDVWGARRLHGARALHAVEHGAGRVIVMDTVSTPELEAWSAHVPEVAIEPGDPADAESYARFERVEAAVCDEELLCRAVPQWVLLHLARWTVRALGLSLQVLSEDRMPWPQSAVFLPGMAAEHHAGLHPRVGDPSFPVFSAPVRARTGHEYHWAVTGSLVTAWMRYLGWTRTWEARQPYQDGWERWQAIFTPVPADRV